MRTCSMAGCSKLEACGVGPMNEPMCQEHFEAWLKGHRSTLDAFRSLLSTEPTP